MIKLLHYYDCYVQYIFIFFCQSNVLVHLSICPGSKQSASMEYLNFEQHNIYIDYLVAEGFVLYIWECNFLVIFPRLLNNVKFLLRIFCDVLLCGRVNECGFHTCKKIKRLHFFFIFPQYYFLTSSNQKLNSYTGTVVIDTSCHGPDKINDKNLE